MSAGRNENLHGFELNVTKTGGGMRSTDGRMMGAVVGWWVS